MTCNAWNHGWNCTCGFSGGHGRGGRRRVGGSGGGQGYVWRHSAVVQSSWSTGETSYESFTRPNARCPVCGDNVFFYQSETGGRVFFDHLGPPWPKHGCTDNPRYRASQGPGAVSVEPSRDPARRAPFEPNGWTPLASVATATWHSGDWDDREFQQKTQLIRGREARTGQQVWFAFERKVTLDPNAPILIRPDLDRPGVLEVESPGLRIGRKSVGQAMAVRAHPLKYDPILPLWFTAMAGDLTAICALAWRFSFGCKAELGRDARKEDLQLAMAWYRLAARQGDATAFNNMGVLLRDGWGVRADLRRAFAYFRRGARSGHPRHLEQLARCYRQGIGTSTNIARAEALEAAAATAKSGRASEGS